ncbi:dihydrolipoamide acetyltransferase family protein [Candidatus Phytoplasma melaleucae]|uniref:2-oxo acid dehydrogenase subunit E2 n=1 Tax=Candidatus Phytoplasma melaleucae TaxID=2982630 RepID=A0ABT9DDY1_9MOLU|nr:dihydrolipoamide acetyltransferase family protein ['Melaleuca sp.' phytoplasma]MDO8168034.1 2-oxo acid dehydrogenase subunit E2 ['Melaleuca sp.' phytoplasma]
MKKNDKHLDTKIKDITDKDVQIESISSLRKAIAEKVTTAKTLIPDTTIMQEFNVDNLVTLREKIKSQEQFKNGNIKLTYMPFIAKAVTIALEQFPRFNSSFDDKNNVLIIKKFINLGIAVDTKNGLIVVNIKNAQNLGVLTLAKEIKTLAENAINRKITLDNLRDGTFTISNYGVFDISYANPIINFPEVAILGIGTMIKKPFVKDDVISIGNMLPLSLTFDHRFIDGADAGRFLQTIKLLLSDISILENHIY